MAKIDKLAHRAVQETFRRTCFPALAALMLSAQCTNAAADDKMVAAPIAQGAPGMIRTGSCARPAYPPEEAEQHHQGTVRMKLLLGPDGKVRKAVLLQSSGHDALDNAALTGIAQCTFNPPMAEGKPVTAWTMMEYQWTL